MQLDLFTTTNPHERKPKTNELAVILDVFGEEAIRGITSILNDVVQLYPFKTWAKPSAIFEYESFLTIGASIEHENYFYYLAEDYCIYRFHQFSMFPDLDKSKQQKIAMEV